jgi:hypothetical protein
MTLNGLKKSGTSALGKALTGEQIRLCDNEYDILPIDAIFSSTFNRKLRREEEHIGLMCASGLKATIAKIYSFTG